ncbi:hypothetical protein FRC02_011635 [Tulasnella sp. 418]|nr:hypothetical protein FRC02_011635 [Tulasnella sp. 418]
MAILVKNLGIKDKEITRNNKDTTSLELPSIFSIMELMAEWLRHPLYGERRYQGSGSRYPALSYMREMEPQRYKTSLAFFQQLRFKPDVSIPRKGASRRIRSQGVVHAFLEID